jgi:hypothetical protein
MFVPSLEPLSEGEKPLNAARRATLLSRGRTRLGLETGLTPARSLDDTSPCMTKRKGQPSTQLLLDTDWLLFWYLNEERVDSLFSQLDGRLESERKDTVSKGVGGTGRLGFEVGSILAAIGLAKGKAEGELRSDYERIREVTSSLSVENKINVLLNHYLQEDSIARVDLIRCSPDEVLKQTASKRLQILAGGFIWHDQDAERAELWSHATSLDVPLITVPLLKQNIPAQQGPFFDEPGVMAHEVFCASLLRRERVLVRPIAIWFPDVDPDTDELTWSSGETTPQIDPETGALVSN